MYLISTKQLFLLILLIPLLNSFQVPQNSQNGGPITDDFCGKFPEASETKEVDEPIIVKGEVDMHYQRLIATKKLRDDCSIEGSVKGKHIIDIEDGGTLKNVILADPAKGVWCEGSCKLINVYWEKVCYHAAGFSGDDSSPKIHEVTNSTALHAPDKFFTQSSKGKTIIRNFCGHEFGKVYCSCGSGCQPQYQRSVEIYDSRFKGPGLTLISLNHNYKDSMSMSNVYVDPNPKIKYICQEYTGTTQTTGDMTPTASFTANEAGKGQSCNYSTKEYSLAAETNTKENNSDKENQKEGTQKENQKNDKND